MGDHRNEGSLMSMTLESAGADVDEAIRMRDRARELLARLLRDRDTLETALSGTGRCDHLKQVTGRSALDNAIAATQRVIEAIDRAVSGAGDRVSDRLGQRGDRSGWAAPMATAGPGSVAYRRAASSRG